MFRECADNSAREHKTAWQLVKIDTTCCSQQSHGYLVLVRIIKDCIFNNLSSRTYLNMWNALDTASKILRARLAHINRVDVRVLDQRSAQSSTNLNEYPGRMFCYFGARPNTMPYLLVFARADLNRDISHIFGFYVDTNYRIIQKPERKLFENKLQAGARLGIEIKLGVVKADVKLPKPCHLSMLLQMAEFLLDESLFTNFVAEKEISNCQFSSLTCFNPTIPFPTCRIMEIDAAARKVWDRINDKRLIIIDFDINNPPARVTQHFNVLRIIFNEHLLYGIHYRSEGIMMILLTHPSLFQCEEDSEDVVSTIQQVMANSKCKLRYIGATRFFRQVNDVCNSPDVLKALLLALNLPLLTIKKFDLDLAFQDEDLDSAVDEIISVHLSQEPGPSVPYPPNWSDDEEILPNLDVPTSPQSSEDTEIQSVTIPLDINPATCEPNERSPSPLLSMGDFAQSGPSIGSQSTSIVDVTCSNPSSQASSQRTIILSQRDIDNELSRMRRARAIKETLKGDFPTLDVVPMDDPFNRIFTDNGFFKRELEHIVGNFGLPAVLLSLVKPDDLVGSLENALESNLRLLVAPVQTPRGLMLLLVDKQTEEWGLLNPDADTQRDLSAFKRFKDIMTANSSYFKSYGARQLPIPCHFHRRYKPMHLLLSIYRVCQAFGIANMLPLRITYTEKRLRFFCYEVCKELQEKNRVYNINNGLVRSNNFLKPGAFKSLPSPLVFEKSVVATDQCLFCEKRYSKNLGSHMSMEHGGQAAAKRQRRRWLESL